ncbi:MAG: Ig-like domain-containing protein, partial [Patescibacteria group bacterium]
VETSAKRGVTRVDYYLDDMFLGSSREAPYSYGHQSNDTTNGIHTLKAIAFDDIDNSESAQVNFNLLLNK